MAYPVNSIATETFGIVKGTPPTEQYLSELIERVGVDGSSRRLIGLRNRPFVLRSQVSVLDRPGGFTKMRTYAGLIDDGPVNFTWNDYVFNTATPAFKVRVLGVRHVETQLTLSMVGAGVTVGHGAILIAEWDLQLVPA